MTLVPASDYTDRSVKSLDERRVYEIYPGNLAAIRDFEGRTLEPGPQPTSLTIAGPPARITLRWCFTVPHRVVLNGQNANIRTSPGGEVSVEFDHRGRDSIRWE